MVHSQDTHAKKHWQGNYWGANGAVKEGLFKFLSTLYSSLKSAPSRRHKLAAFLGVLALYMTLRTCYKLADHTANELDVLASVSRRLGQRTFAIECGETAIEAEGVMSPSYPLLLAGLMRDHEALFPLKKGGQESGRYFNQLRSVFQIFEFDPPEQKIRIFRALAWFTAMNGSKKETSDFVKEALTLANSLGAEDQIRAIVEEFHDYI